MSTKFKKYIGMKKRGGRALDQNFLFYVDFQYVNKRNDSLYELGSFMVRTLASIYSRGFELLLHSDNSGKISFISFREKLLMADKNILSKDALFFCETIENVNDMLNNQGNLYPEDYSEQMSELDAVFIGIGQQKLMNSLAEILLTISEDYKRIWKEYRLESFYE
jgi:hypothetical protein